MVGAVRILVVDSTPRGQRNLALGLQREGFDLLLPANMSEAYEAIAEDTFHVAVFASDLPGQEVVALLRALRMQARTLGLGVVALCDRETPALTKLMGSFGVHHIVTRPVDLSRLLAALHDLAKPLPRKGQAVLLRDPLGGATFRTVVASAVSGRVRLTPEDEADALELAHFRDRMLEAEFVTSDHSEVVYEAEVGNAPGGQLLVDMGTLVRREQRRKSFRRELALRVRYRLAGDFARLGVSRDVSLGGVLLSGVRGEPRVGDPVEVSLVLGAQRTLGPLPGTVRRLVPGADPLWGISFDDLPEARLNELLEVLFGDARQFLLVAPEPAPVPGHIPGM